MIKAFGRLRSARRVDDDKKSNAGKSSLSPIPGSSVQEKWGNAISTVVSKVISSPFCQNCFWNPSKKQQISQVEQIQRKVARFVFNDYRDRSPGAVTNMIDTLQWDSLACRRTKASLILLYKINGVW